MLTPVFQLSQDEKFINITIKAPYTKISETEIFIEGDEFKFYSKPYYLRLNLPGNIVENEDVSAKYDSDDGTFNVKVAKETPGEHFGDLDMITKLLAPKSSTPRVNAGIEELESATDSGQDPADEEEEELEFDWQIKQEPFEEDNISLGSIKYGFANQKSCVFDRLQNEMVDIIDLPNADQTLAHERTKLRESHEEDKFDEDYYLADLYNDEHIQEIIKYKPSWIDDFEKKNDSKDWIGTFTDEENEKLRKLPRRSYLIDDNNLSAVYLCLVDIIFAYAYDYRTTEGENSVESNWTISKLSASLSWLQVHHNLRDTVRSSLRRSLCYPLYRNWSLSTTVLRDTRIIFSLGKKTILRCLLRVHDIFNQSDPKYILNDVFITDYCVWIQSASSKQIQSLADALEQIYLKKEDLDLGLLQIEHAAAMVIEGDEDENGPISRLEQQLAGVSITAKDRCHHSNDLDSESHSELDSDDDSSDSDESESDEDESSEETGDDHDDEGEGDVDTDARSLPCVDEEETATKGQLSTHNLQDGNQNDKIIELENNTKS